MRSRKLAIAAVSAAVAISAGSSFAQTSKGILTGIARDSVGAVIPGARVAITNEETGEMRETVTKNDGAYRLEGVPPGRYTVLVQSVGLKLARPPAS